MAGGKWEVWWATDSGRRIKPLGPALRSMHLKLVSNGLGFGQFSFPLDTIALSDLSVDQQLQVYYSPDDDGVLTPVRVFFLRHWILQRTATGDGELRLSGPCQNHLLARRVIPFEEGETEAEKTDNADDMMKAMVRENLGASATDTDRDITGLNFSIEADSGDGLSITKSFPFTNLLEALQTVSLATRGNNRVNSTEATNTWFDVVIAGVDVDGTPSFEFRTFTQQPGLDRRESTGDAPMVFSEQRGNLVAPIYEIDYTDEVNFAYVGETTVSAVKTVREVSYPGAIAESQWNRMEAFVNVAGDDNTAADNKGYEYIERHRPDEGFAAELLNTPQSKYLRDWNLGDYVTVRAFGRTFEDIIRNVDIRVDQGRGTRIVGEFENGAMFGNAQIGIIKKMAAIERRLVEVESIQ